VESSCSQPADAGKRGGVGRDRVVLEEEGGGRRREGRGGQKGGEKSGVGKEWATKR